MESFEILKIAANALNKKKAREMTAKKVADLTVLCEYFLICTATSSTQVRALCDEVDKAVRSALYSLISKQTYKNAQAPEQKKMVDSVKRKVRDGIKDKYKARYKSVRVTEFDKILAMK